MPRFSEICFVLPLVLPLAACDPETSLQLGNPAAKFCVAEGGRYEVVETEDRQIGTCLLSDGTRIEAWDYFREQTTG